MLRLPSMWHRLAQVSGTAPEFLAGKPDAFFEPGLIVRAGNAIVFLNSLPRANFADTEFWTDPSVKGTDTMSYEQLQSCIDACLRCAKECEHCSNSCLTGRNSSQSEWTRLTRDCAQVCLTAASLMCRDSRFSQDICRLCAECCEMCAQQWEQNRQQLDQCQPCADACRECAEQCHRIVGVTV